MRDNVLTRKKAGLILMLAKALKITPEKALGVFYPTNVNRMLSDGRFGLQLMCNRSLVRDVLAELRECGDMKSKNQTVRKSGNVHARRGSALLVVLGMLSFMLFSGLAFSVYMRQSRMPTSFLRRTVATRQLAKAALAEAIEEIDTAIGNDPHPGVRASGKQFSDGRLDNFWKYRVFTGYGTSTDPEENNNSGNNQNATYYPELVDPDETVPTLTLEGLAYLPPNLINEVRFYSQRTPTAKWKSFWFDSGRYAYTAIDVSDYFDVNRVYANKPRSSGNRVSLAHLFEKITASGEGEDREVKHEAGSGADKWDTFMDEFRVAEDKMPLVSLADLNIAWGKQSFNFGGSAHGNPFYNFINNSGVAYSGGESDAEAYRGMSFVTDSWFPEPSRDGDGKVFYCCLADPKYQPFKMESLEKKNFKPSIDDVGTLAHSDRSVVTWMGRAGNDDALRLTHPNLTALWDYLDADSVPISLSVPTVERTPMICGIRPLIDGDVELPLVQSPEAGDMSADSPGSKKQTIGSDGWDLYSREITYKIDASKLVDAIQDINVLTIYPFRDHGYQGKDVDTSWNVDARLSVFLTTEGDASPARMDEFAAVPKKADFTNSEVTDGSLISFHFKGNGAMSASDYRSGTSEAGLFAKPDQLRKESGVPDANNMAILKVKYTWARDKYPPVDPTDPSKGPDFNATPTPTNKDPVFGGAGFKIESVTVGTFSPLAGTGKKAEPNWHGDLKNTVDLKLNFAVWVRLANSNGDTVDFVPACQTDDVNMNGGEESKCAQYCGGTAYGYPLMRAIADNVNDGIQLSVANLTSGTPTLGKAKFQDVKWVVSDPRYNFAPENWVQTIPGGALQASDWTDADWGNGKKMKDVIKERDGDMYMATSDAGYLQSIYELAFLPRTADGFAVSLYDSPFYGNLDTTFNGKYRDKFSEAKDEQWMWKTYSPTGRYGADEFTELENIIIQDPSVRVSPYSTSTESLMAAFANTPHDWRLASTNDDNLVNMTGGKFNGDHAWNDYSSDKDTGKVCWDCLQAIAEEFQEKVRKTGDWEKAFKNLKWSRDTNKIIDFEEIDFDEDADVPMYSVDKKFLYGFWHDSFAARQQLFLIFVRAEPMMMGGGVSGQVPPQLGARAVALVWRDPTKTQNRSGSSTLANPHRTRILFYHQFD